MVVDHSLQKKKKRLRAESNEQTESESINDDIECNEGETNLMSNADMVNIMKSNNAMLKELKEMYVQQCNENAQMRMELQEIKEINNRLLNILESKEDASESNNKFMSSVQEVKKSLQETLSKVSDQIINTPRKPLYSSVTKRNTAVIVVKPKNKSQTSDNTKMVVKNALNPTEFLVQGVRNANNGSIVIECEGNDKIEQLRNNAEKKLGPDYEITAPAGRCPKVKLIGICDEMSEDEILNALIVQNKEIFSDCPPPRIVHRFKTKKSAGIKMEVSGKLFDRLMIARRVIVGFETCIAYEAFDISRCFNCCGYHHAAKSCKAPKICGKCSLNHNTNECDSDELKCINCLNAANALRMEIDVNHSAFSFDCLSYKKKIELERKRINYCIEMTTQ